MRSRHLLLIAVGSAALGLSFPNARAALVERTPTVHVAVPGVESQAQLADTLRAEGYSGVVMSSVVASVAFPYPQTVPSFISHPERTPVHAGWNGVAYKDGKTVQVYVDR